MSQNEFCLTERIRDSDPASERAVTTVCVPIVYRWCRRWGVPEKDAPKVVKRVFKSLFSDLRDHLASDQVFLSLLWTRSRYHASEHPRVNSMAVPENYPGDVSDSIVADDVNRLTRKAAEVLIHEMPTETQPVLEALLGRSQTPVQAAAGLPLTLSEIRLTKNLSLIHI